MRVSSGISKASPKPGWPAVASSSVPDTPARWAKRLIVISSVKSSRLVLDSLKAVGEKEAQPVLLDSVFAPCIAGAA
jgi:hypothetical protein